MSVVDIETAKPLRRAGMPLNLPVEHREFAAESSKHYCALWDDLTKFCVKMYDYNKEQTPKNFKSWKRALIKLDRDAKALFDYATGLKNDEGSVLLRFLLERVTPFTEGWAEIFAALEAGEEVAVPPLNKWLWNPLEGRTQ